MVITVTALRRWSSLQSVWRSPRLLARVALTGIVLTANWTTYVSAVVNGNVIETALGYFMAPLGTMSVGVLVLRERLRLSQQVAIAFAVVAIAVITVSYGRAPWLAIGIAATWTLYAYLKKRVPLSAVDGMAAETLMMLLPAVIVAIAFAQHSDSIVVRASGVDLLFVAGTGLATVGPLTLFAFASQRVPLSMLGLMQYIVPTINFLLGWLAYEAMPFERVAGFILVWTGLAVMAVDGTRRARAVRRHRIA
jgi:chloramphenicol-sensitive protein RarD